MVIVGCPVPGCEFESQDLSEALVIAILTIHGFSHQHASPVMAAPAQAPAPHGPRLDRPKVDVGVSIEEWNVFIRRWDVFRAGSGIGDAQVPFQLFQCAGSVLGDSLLKAAPDAATDELCPEPCGRG
ncbi:hypothetical protein CesoFtcFv8_018283 [Champsocephalus esox]|uniref:Uncharacterized protein n=1 Tax=Champsocephalus esox TaxID=159716 RepID=A0AAN8GM73_9TELE|nr:hypothetical protein CesoFtcFv8_018283 [Champsocephalus esox]